MLDETDSVTVGGNSQQVNEGISVPNSPVIVEDAEKILEIYNLGKSRTLSSEDINRTRVKINASCK